ncbi:ABC transporter permease subunit, partial [Saccharothrix algeriensis]
ATPGRSWPGCSRRGPTGNCCGRSAPPWSRRCRSRSRPSSSAPPWGWPSPCRWRATSARPRGSRSVARWTATVFRSVPELLWALVFVAAVGLGPAAGVYAISLHAAGLLAKLVSEQLEAVDAAPVEAVRLTGATKLATAVLAIVPQARNNIASLVLYQWECNIRGSAIIGFVGAGGIGQALGISMRLFRYEELATLMIALLVLVLSVDRISRFLRGRMGAATR